MSTTYLGKGDRIPYTAGTGGASSGDVVAMRTGATGFVGVIVADIAASGTGEADIEGVFRLTKATGSVNVFAIGDIVYWDVTDGNCQAVGSANIKAGVAVAAAAAAATTVDVKLIPSKA